METGDCAQPRGVVEPEAGLPVLAVLTDEEDEEEEEEEAAEEEGRLTAARGSMVGSWDDCVLEVGTDVPF